MFKPTILCAASVLAMHAPAAMAQDSTLAQRIDAAISPYYQAGEPGAAVIVTKGLKVPAILIELAEKNDVPLLRSKLKTGELYRRLQP